MQRLGRILRRVCLGLAVCSLVSGCSADLNEMAGPRLPLPNVTGRILRDEAPVASFKVELRDPETDEALFDARTDASGVYTFHGVGEGHWVLRADSAERSDWSRSVYEFSVSDPEVLLELPGLDVFSRGLRIEKPGDGGTEDVPTVFDPIEFEWRHDGLTRAVQIRLYEDRDGGAGVWFSNETTATLIRWNGFANQGSYAGRSVPAGRYRWRLRMSHADVEYETAYYHITVKD